METERYKVKWAHHDCHPETCSHMGNYRIYDNIEKCYFHYDDDEIFLQKICDRLNKEEQEKNFEKLQSEEIKESLRNQSINDNQKSLEDIEEDKIENDFVKIMESPEWKEHYRKYVESETWGKGIPMVYMNEKGEIVKHYKDGKIEIIDRINK